MTTKKTSIADELCYLMFCQNKQKHKMLSPKTDCLLHHLKQPNYKAFGRSHALEAVQVLGWPEGHNHKSTDTCKPSQADDMQVQDVWPPAKLLLQQHKTCLHRRMLLHGRWWRMWEPPWSDLCQWLRRKQWREYLWRWTVKQLIYEESMFKR